MLNVDPETVRRWIRSGKLKSIQQPKKLGNVITEEMLDSFIQSAPKYASAIKPATSTQTNVAGLATYAAALIGSAAAKQFVKASRIKSAEIELDIIVKLLEEKHAENKKEINRLSNDNRQIEELMRQLKKLNDTSKE